jgi:hypothetical protein
MLVIAGLFAVLSALGGDTVGAVAGLLVAGAGAMERHGGMLLVAGEPRGIRWTIVAELFALFAILAYCQVRMITVDISLLKAALPEATKAELVANGISIDDFLRYYSRVVIFIVAAATLLYQGGMAWYYVRRRRAVETALAEQPDI